jgi:hypothetical protein
VAAPGWPFQVAGQVAEQATGSGAWLGVGSPSTSTRLLARRFSTPNLEGAQPRAGARASGSG